MRRMLALSIFCGVALWAEGPYLFFQTQSDSRGGVISRLRNAYSSSVTAYVIGEWEHNRTWMIRDCLLTPLSLGTSCEIEPDSTSEHHLPPVARKWKFRAALFADGAVLGD